MTEIPEHLLKRSKAAKGKSTGDSDSASSEGAAESAPVAAANTPAAPASSGPGGLTASESTVTFPNLDPEPEAPKPEPAFVTAAKARNRIPVWALPVVAALPIWAMSYAGTMQQPDVEDPVFVDSAAVYTEAGCAGCHGGAGGGGVGYQLSDGEVLATFPKVVDQMVHVARGSADIDGETYGADGRRVSGESGSQMPAQAGSLSRHDLELVVFHERAVLSGEDQDQAGYQEWMQHMREHTAEGDQIVDDEYIEFLLGCATPDVTPGATGAGAPDEDHPCPGPHAEE